jgi:hypothetical protein
MHKRSGRRDEHEIADCSVCHRFSSSPIFVTDFRPSPIFDRFSPDLIFVVTDFRRPAEKLPTPGLHDDRNR